MKGMSPIAAVISWMIYALNNLAYVISVHKIYDDDDLSSTSFKLSSIHKKYLNKFRYWNKIT